MENVRTPAQRPAERKTPLQRMVRGVLWAIAVLLAILLTLFVLRSVLDERLDPLTQRWLEQPMPHADPGRNGYIAMFLLDAGEAATLDDARAFHRQQQTIYTQAGSSRQYDGQVAPYKRVKDELLKPRQDTAVPALIDDCRSDCYRYFASLGARLDPARDRLRLPLQRYQQVLDAPDYVEDAPRDPRAIEPNYALANRLGVLFLEQVYRDFQAGATDAAYRNWAVNQRLWQTALAGTTTFAAYMHTVGQLERSQALLLQMLDARPATLATAKAHAAPVLHARTAAEPLLATSLAREFQLGAFVLTNLVHHLAVMRMTSADEDMPLGLADRTALLLYQRNASLNLMQRQITADLARHGTTRQSADPPSDDPCRAPGLRNKTLNLMGHSLACSMTSLRIDAYRERAGQVDQSAAVLLSRLR